MKQYETVIGLEVHVELATKTKIFCGCSTEFGGAPNTHTCPVCTGMPGSLPVLNKKVVEFALKAGLAANCQINQYCKFDRKNYFYPDNPQNYQISQLYLPICHDGWVEIETSSGKKKIRIHEMHMEEDAGKLIHDEWEDCSLVDYNRSGVPLIEIVSEPDMRSSEEVIAYLEKLRCMMQYLAFLFNDGIKKLNFQVYKEKRTEIVQMVQNNQIKIRKDMELIELPEDYKKCSSGGEAVVRKNNGSYTVGFWYTQGFLDSGFSLFAYSNDDSRTDVIQMVKEYGGIEYEINLSEKEKGWYYVTAKVGE